MSGNNNSELTWLNVAIGLGFIAFDALLSLILGLGIGGSLVVAATRCIVQLTVMGLVLDKVFAAQNVWGVAGIARECPFLAPSSGDTAQTLGLE
jgi:ABC-type iron transport system FetAB permease component